MENFSLSTTCAKFVIRSVTFPKDIEIPGDVPKYFQKNTFFSVVKRFSYVYDVINSIFSIRKKYFGHTLLKINGFPFCLIFFGFLS